MKPSKDPFAAAFSDDESPPESPSAVHVETRDEDDTVYTGNPNPNSIVAKSKGKGKAKEDEEDEDEDEDMDMEEEENNNNNNNNNNNMDTETETEVRKLPSSGSGAESTDPHKIAKMQSILSQFTEEQMSRYESFRRSGFQKSIMKRLLVSITGSNKISVPMTIVVSGIAKMFVGELVETARVVMAERKDSGPIRPCHIRESYRRLKLEGKIPKRSVPRLFR